MSGKTAPLLLLLCAAIATAATARGASVGRAPGQQADTQQPDKILYDKAVKDIEHGRYETARLTLNTLINTYDSSEFLAKAKLEIADPI